MALEGPTETKTDVPPSSQMTKTGQAWLTDLNTTCNRLNKNYLTLLRAATSQDDLSGNTGHRSGGSMVRWIRNA